jgi:hypothetical protein
MRDHQWAPIGVPDDHRGDQPLRIEFRGKFAPLFAVNFIARHGASVAREAAIASRSAGRLSFF